MSIPQEDLDDRTYEELVRDALSRIPIYAPRWTDRNETDPGVTFIELFAWLAEMQIYSLNRIDDKSRLKFLKLLGVPRPYPPRPAEVDITFELKGNSTISIPKETAVGSLNARTGELIRFETVSEASLSPTASTAKVHAVQGIWKSKEFQPDGSANLLLKMDESIFIQNAQTMENVLKVEVNGVQWEYWEDLDGSHGSDSHFIADFKAWTITFGDGTHGKIPEKGNIIVKYRSAAGSRGNVKAGTIDQILDPVLAASATVKNTEAASGGTDVQETLESAIGRARKDLKEVTRAVTTSDYEYLALTCPGVRLDRARALEMYHPSHEDRVHTVVSVAIVPKSKSSDSLELAVPTKEEISLVRKHLEEYRLMGTELFVLSPEYVRVKVETVVARDLRYLEESVEKAVKDALAEFLKPTEGGGPDGKGWPFGRPVYLSEVQQVIDGATGVDHVIDLPALQIGGSWEGFGGVG